MANQIDLRAVVEKEFTVIGPEGEILRLVTATVPLQVKYFELKQACFDAMAKKGKDSIEYGDAAIVFSEFVESLIITDKTVFKRVTVAQRKSLYNALTEYLMTGELPEEKIEAPLAVPELPAPLSEPPK